MARSALLSPIVLSATLAAMALLAGCSSDTSGGEAETRDLPDNAETQDAGADPVTSNAPPLAEGTASAAIDRTNAMDISDASTNSDSSGLETITLGSGCFWCTEAVLEQIEGVRDVVSGYMGGSTLNPSYAEICTGRTGHAEVVQVKFDPKVLPVEHLLAWFWRLHDPTTLNRQGADVGTQYRSAIFYHSETQREAAEVSMRGAQPDFSDPIVTEITEAATFYRGEDKHQDYYRNNSQAGYCRAVIAPKLDKLNLKR
ncbi:MAG: peptide-methionine (S)-S-oxide reductase [Planctomycetota bacterium]|jgi:peptide-methionine (S)-S-oxide reductase